MMKKRGIMKNKGIFVLLATSLMLTSCSLSDLIHHDDGPQDETYSLTLTLTEKEKTMVVGDSFSITLLDQNNEDRIDLADWTLSNENTVTRSNKGEIIAFAPGEVDIIATIDDYYANKWSITIKEYKCHVVVNDRNDPEYLFFKENAPEKPGLTFEQKYSNSQTKESFSMSFSYDYLNDLTIISYTKKVRSYWESMPAYYYDYTYRGTISFHWGEFKNGKFSAYYENYTQTSSYSVSKRSLTFKNEYLEFDDENKTVSLNYTSNCFTLGSGNIDGGYFIKENCQNLIARFNDCIVYANEILTTYNSDLILF